VATAAEVVEEVTVAAVEVTAVAAAASAAAAHPVVGKHMIIHA
jgi:hypothetical protein